MKSWGILFSDELVGLLSPTHVLLPRSILTLNWFWASDAHHPGSCQMAGSKQPLPLPAQPPRQGRSKSSALGIPFSADVWTKWGVITSWGAQHLILENVISRVRRSRLVGQAINYSCFFASEHVRVCSTRDLKSLPIKINSSDLGHQFHSRLVRLSNGWATPQVRVSCGTALFLLSLGSLWICWFSTQPKGPKMVSKWLHHPRP